MDEKFKSAVEKVLAHEGGYVDDPDDPGGETKFGISKRTYPEVDIKSLTREKAVEIYYREWWERYGYVRIADSRIAAKVFDLAVNVGPGKAHRMLQSSVNETSGEGLEVDGRLGDASIAAVNRHPGPDHLLSVLKLTAVGYYLRLRKPKFLAGWIARAIS